MVCAFENAVQDGDGQIDKTEFLEYILQDEDTKPDGSFEDEERTAELKTALQTLVRPPHLCATGKIQLKRECFAHC